MKTRHQFQSQVRSPKGAAMVRGAPRRRAGFTLVELMVALLATAILVLAVSFIMVIPVRTIKGNRALAQTRRELAYAARVMNRDIRVTAWGDIDDDLVNEHVKSDYLLLDYDVDNPLVRDENALYQKVNDTLVRTVNGVDEVLITEGLRRFEPSTIHVGDRQGLVVAMEVEIPETGSSIVKTNYVHVRN